MVVIYLFTKFNHSPQVYPLSELDHDNISFSPIFPKQIHQTWMDVPLSYQDLDNVDSWIGSNPIYDYLFYNDTTLLRWVRTKFAHRPDIIRIIIELK